MEPMGKRTKQNGSRLSGTFRANESIEAGVNLGDFYGLQGFRVWGFQGFLALRVFVIIWALEL